MGPSILLVDDDEESTSLLKLILEAEGYDTETASTAAEAYDKAGRRKFDLVLLDYVLGDASGDEAAARLREECLGIRVVLLSGVNSDKVKNEVYDAVLLKPVSPDVLLRTIRESL